MEKNPLSSENFDRIRRPSSIRKKKIDSEERRMDDIKLKSK